MKSGGILTAVLAFLLVLGGCGVQASVPKGNFTDDLGRSVSIQGVPQRIISLSPSNTETVYALGLEDKLIGVTTFCNYPPAARNKPQVSEYSNVDSEKLVSLQPDLILADHIHKDTVIPGLEKLGLTVFTLSPGTLAGLMHDISLLGQVSGKNQAADILVARLQSRIKSVTEKTARLAENERPRVFFLTWYDPLWTEGADTLINELIVDSGGVNIAADLSGHAEISLETIVQRNPQVILVLSSMGDQNTSLDYIRHEPRLQELEAVKNNRVYVIDVDIFTRTTPRTVDGLEQLAGLINPEIFK
jgi:iron complex transport system substrate-binding protein